MGFTVRPATVVDHVAFVRLFPELRVPDPVLTREQFAERMLPRVIILEEAGEATGYAAWRIYGDAVHVVHVVVDPRGRGRGAGRALLEDVRARVVGGGAARWFLNVKQDNASAIRLYEKSGMTVEQEGWALDVPWAALSSLPADAGAARATAFTPGPADDVELSSRLGVDLDRVAVIRVTPGSSVLLALREDGAPVAFAAFNPAFPGIYPLRVARLGVARPLFDALRLHARHDHVRLFVEGDRPLCDALRAAGAALLHATFRMGARL